MIAEFKEQTKSVFAQVSEATGNFREIDRLDAVQNLPGSVSAGVFSLAALARNLSLKLGYDVARYECLDENEAVSSLVIVDEVTRDIAAKDTPAARRRLSSFLKLDPKPSAGNHEPLWRYLSSALSLCNRLKNEAATHLQQAQSFDSAGKKSEALREYQEIYRLYPNPATAETIRQLEGQPHQVTTPETE